MTLVPNNVSMDTVEKALYRKVGRRLQAVVLKDLSRWQLTAQYWDVHVLCIYMCLSLNGC